jgi:cellulose biosynthesis protein BcsQ
MNVKSSRRGIVYTFYSFKGGVGRTMALANVAALLERWGHSVLVVDWDLEAPGLERFFVRLKADLLSVRTETLGIVDLVKAREDNMELSWRERLIPITPGLSMLTAGRNDTEYARRLHSLNFQDLFERHDLGEYIERLRNEWIAAYDFILVDSRTGVTDIGGICTLHLADVLVLLFTTTESSMEGALDILRRARNAQSLLPVDRTRLFAVPVPARDEIRTEYQRASEWKNKFAEAFSEVYRDWLPAGITSHDAIELLRIPYIPYWSFGEQLPAILEGTTDPASLGHAYEILARLLSERLDWSKAVEGHVAGTAPKGHQIDQSWLKRHRAEALRGLRETTQAGYLEIVHHCPDIEATRSQTELLDAARAAVAPVVGLPWPIGAAVASGEDRPRPTQEGVVASVSGYEPYFAYWTLNRSCDFYSLTSLSEDYQWAGTNREISVHLRIAQAEEAIVHCKQLYEALGFAENTVVELSVRFVQLRYRVLVGKNMQPKKNMMEDMVESTISFRLDSVESELVTLVSQLCNPLFVVFDFAQIPSHVYEADIQDARASRQLLT